MEGPPLGPGGEDITWPDQVAPRGRKASSTRKIKPQTSNLNKHIQNFISESCSNFLFLRVQNGLKTSYISACALQGIAARWLSAHYKNIARSIARAMARGLGFVTPCPNKQGKNTYFSKVSDASGTACDAVNVREDCKHFGPPEWVVPVEERGPFGEPS